MTKRAALLLTAAAAVVATSETALVLQLVDTERARRKLAAHRCPPVGDRTLSSVDPIDAALLDQPAEVLGA